MPAHPKSHTLRRSLELLNALPTAGSGLTPQELQRQLASLGHEVNTRTVQRDLLTLREQFPALSCDDTGKPHRWRWDSAAAKAAVAGMSTPEALSLVMVEQHLQAALPGSMAESFKPLFDRAQAQLDRLTALTGARTWPSKVRVIPPGLQHQPALEPSEAVLVAVSDALLQSRQLTLDYQRGAGGKPSPYDVAPLGLVMRGAVRYLIGLVKQREPRWFALHRIRRAEVHPQPARIPAGMTLDEVLESTGGQFGVSSSTRPVMLTLICDPGLTNVLEEAPLDASQSVERLPEGRSRLRASVQAGWELRWWLLAHAEELEVESPPELRQWMHDALKAAAERHR